MKSINQIYNLVLETLLLEAMSLEEIFKTYYEKDLRISLSTFKEINSIDHTGTDSKKGKYLDWLIRKAYKENPRMLEDSSKIKEDLDLFDKNYRHINKQITQIKDQYELASLVEQFREKKEKGEIDLSRAEIKKDIEKIYEDSDWLILSPKTEEAAKYYGKNTRWCTAAENNNMFDEYNKNGPLYILINKKVPDEKYQFHFQTQQYMDSADNTIYDFYKFPKHMLNKLVKLAKKNNNVIGFILELSYENQQKYKKIYAIEYNAFLLGKELLKQLKFRNLEKIKELIDNGADIHIQNELALTSAAENGHLELVKYLVEKRANIHTDNDYALRVSAKNGHLEIVKYLIKKGANIYADDNFALRIAAENGHLELVKYLVEKGADIHAVNDYALRYAAENGHLEIVKYLVEKRANIHTDNDYALRVSAYSGRLELVKYLVEKGADIHAVNDYALRFATNKGHLDVVKYLVEKRANIHTYDDEV